MATLPLLNNSIQSCGIPSSSVLEAILEVKISLITKFCANTGCVYRNIEKKISVNVFFICS